MTSAMASTCSGMATGRSGEDSLPAPMVRHGLAGIFSSSTATLRMARSKRYAFAGRVLVGWSALVLASQVRTDSTDTSPSATSPNVVSLGQLMGIAGVMLWSG